jgi:tetratricopeptide (TPR) repeat protein
MNASHDTIGADRMAHLLLASLVLLGVAAAAAANPDEPVTPPRAAPAVNAEARFNEGLASAQRNDWASAEKAYLRLRPRYPQALEYLGEAYVHLGRLDDARAVLGRLRPLDPREADELAEAIARASKR